MGEELADDPLDEDSALGVNDIWNLMSDLRIIALNLLSRERKDCSYRATALIHSGLRRYKLADQSWEEITWKNRSHFFKTTHMMMRRALIDHARKKKVRPSTVSTEYLDFENFSSTLEQTPERIIHLEEALQWLSNTNPELEKIIQHHFYTGLNVEEIARLLETSPTTVKRRLKKARTLIGMKIKELEKVD